MSSIYPSNSNTPAIGEYSELIISEEHSAGLLLDGGTLGNILLPNNQVRDEFQLGERLRVFIYLDSEDRVIATCQRPRVQVGQVANLEVIDINDTGAFLDWGLSKDLFLPYSEQKQPLKVGQYCVVYVSLDNTQRIVASTHLSHHIKDAISPDNHKYKAGSKARLLIAGRTDLGYKAVVDHKYWGIISNDIIREPLRIGQRYDGYIRRVREDLRLDLSIEPIGYKKVDGLSEQILARLNEGDGFLAIGDKSPAGLIEKHFSVSKRAYKMAIGKLYKDRIITIETDGIRLLKDN